MIYFDIESYPNYFLVTFYNGKSKRFKCLESGSDDFQVRDLSHDIRQVLERKETFVSFNGTGYDVPMLGMALKTGDAKEINAFSNEIIKSGQKWWNLVRKHGLERIQFDHIDLMQVAPLMASLKMYAARMGYQDIRNLPYPPDTMLTHEQKDIVRTYCENDCRMTEALHKQLQPEIKLRETLGNMYEIDLRSKSDAQVGEAVVVQEITRIRGEKPTRPTEPPDEHYRLPLPYHYPYGSKALRALPELFKNSTFVLHKQTGHYKCEEINGTTIDVGDMTYKIGLGGLHSTEKCQKVEKEEGAVVMEYDVTSYYPNIIMKNGLAPRDLGEDFTKIYRGLVERRLKAKKEGDGPVNESLKISINGMFGKFSSKWSPLYSPEMGLHITIPGQLYLLLLIEQLEDAGAEVFSANTDGVFCRFKEDAATMNGIEKALTFWQKWTGFELEGREVHGRYARDVNNYFVVYDDREVKGKGAWAEQTDRFNLLRKNPVLNICRKAVIEKVVRGSSFNETITSAWEDGINQINGFCTVRNVEGGGIWRDQRLGKVVRWLQAIDGEPIFYANNGNKVPRSDGAFPVMNFKEFYNLDPMPDIDIEWYEEECEKLWAEVGLE